MPKDELVSNQAASEQIFNQIEQNLEAGGVRDVWQNVRKELAEGVWETSERTLTRSTNEERASSSLRWTN